MIKSKLYSSKLYALYVLYGKISCVLVLFKIISCYMKISISEQDYYLVKIHYTAQGL